MEISSFRRSGNVHSHAEIVTAWQLVVVVAWHLIGVVRPVAHVLARQEHVDLAEGRPSRIVDVPALDQKVVDFPRTDARLK